MMIPTDRIRAVGRWRRLLRGTAVLGALLAAAACDNLLEVDTPDRVPAQQLEQPANAQLLVNGVIADFECAFGAYTVIGGLIGDELVDVTQTANRYPYDQRVIQPSDARYSQFACEELGVYTPLQAARASADNVLNLLERSTDQQVPNRTALIATASAYGAYSLLLLGEGFCSAVVSTLGPDGNPVFGGEISRDSVLELAVARFDQAIAAARASNQTDILNMALVGKARALVDLGRFEQAREAAAQVPASFIRNATASDITDRRRNRVFTQSSATNTSVSVGEPFRGLNDPRVPVVPVLDAQGNVRRSVTGVPLFEQRKYRDANSPIPIATGDETQLIIAEAAARAGELGTAIQIINAFRAAAGQPQFSADTQQAVLNEIIEQRRRELFLESQRLGDLIRFDLPFDPPPGAPFHGGGVYGSQRCLPLPDIEKRNNPNIGV